MKKTKILTVLGVLLAMGITACGGKTSSKNNSSAEPAPSSQPAPSSGSQSTPSSGSQSTPSSSSVNPGTEKDATGHIWGADTDVAASGEGVAYKKATCTENDGFIKLTINQSQVTYVKGGRKSSTPEGYTKLNSNNDMMAFKFNYDSYAVGKFYLYGCMDGWSSNSGKQAFYYQGSPNLDIKVNGNSLDITKLENVVYTDFLSGDGSDLSDDGYGCVGDIVIHEGINEISYERLGSMNTLVKDFVLVVKNEEHTHEFSEWAEVKAATCVDLGSKKRACSCGLSEQVDVNTLPHDLDADTEVIKLNSDGKKVMQYDCKTGKEKVAAIAMKDISGVFKTDAVEGQAEKWTIGDNANKAAADTYKMDKGTALLFKLSVSEAVNGAFISIGGKFSNANQRHFYNHGDGGQNGDDPAADQNRYYTKVNDGEFTPVAFNDYMQNLFGDGSEVRYIPLGKFNLVAGENLIYIRQGNLGYRVTLQGFLYVALNGNAAVSGDSPAHAHQAGTEWKSNETKHWHECVGADCDEPGIKLDEADHTFVEDPAKAVAPTCTEAGKKVYACSVCGYEKEEAIPAAHDWNEAVPVEASGDGVAYNKFTCKKCKAVKLEIALDDSMLASGSTNKNDPAGYLKLKANNQKFSFKFNYAVSTGNNIAVGKIYQRGVMDGWTSNSGRNVFSGGSNGADDFELKVNDAKVDLSAYKSKTYAQVMPGDPDTEKNLSPLTDVESGAIVLKDGLNTVSYERLASYNLALTHMVLVVEDFNHEHAAAAEWSKDENSHWHACSAANCPIDGYKMDEAAHTWGEKYDEVAATCQAAGSYKQACSVCGYVKTVVTPKVAHTFGDAQTAINDAVPHECSVCHAMGYELAIPSPQKLKSDVTWNIKGLPAGTYEIELYACASSTTLPQKFDARYQFKVGDGDYISASDDNATYASYGLGTGEKAENCQWSSPINQIAVGENAESFTIHWTNKGYSAFIAAVRLVKVA